MRYLGSLGALSAQDEAAVSGFRQVFSGLSPDGQAAIYAEAKALGGGAEAYGRDRLFFAGAGVLLGGALGAWLARRRRR